MTSWDASRGHRGRATLGGDARWQSLAHALHRMVTVPVLTPKHCPRFQLTIPPALESGVHSAAGRPARMTAELVTAVIRGIPLIRAACAHLASINGLKPNASRAVDGRRIPIGMRICEFRK